MAINFLVKFYFDPRAFGFLFVFVFVAGCVGGQTSEFEKWAPEERAEIHVKLGLTYLKNAQYPIAEEEFQLALEIDNNSDTAHHGLALLHSRVGENDQASEEFGKAISLNNHNYLAINDYGTHLCQQGEFQQGISRLNTILNKAENSQLLGTQLGLGLCYFRTNDYAQALPYLNVVLKISPTLHQVLYPLAKIAFDQGKFLTSRVFLERHFATGVISANSLYLASEVELQLSDIERAKQYASYLANRFPESVFNARLVTQLNAIQDN